MSKVYEGTPGTPGRVRVTVYPPSGNEPFYYPLHHHVRHSPDGFMWGYGGSGPGELARCILIDHFALTLPVLCEECGSELSPGEFDLPCPVCSSIDRKTGRSEDISLPVSYMDFKFEVVAQWSKDEPFTLTTADINEWVSSRG